MESILALNIFRLSLLLLSLAAKKCPYNPTTDPIPWLTEYAWHIPLGVIGMILMWKEGLIGTKTKGQKLMLIILLICFIFFPAVEAYWHFILPAQYPDLPEYKDTRGIMWVECP